MKIDIAPKYSVDIWIDNAEVLARGKRGEKGTNIKDHLVLDYDLLREMEYLQDKIIIPVQWNKVDSHIKSRTYKKGQVPQGNKFSIRLNEVVDRWAGEVREAVVNKPLSVTNPRIYHDPALIKVYSWICY